MIVVVTEGILWMLLESGLAVCVVNLTILYGGFRLKSVGNLINRARSLIQLKETASTESGLHASPGRQTGMAVESDIQLSCIPMESGNTMFEAHVKRGESLGSLEEGLMHVTRTIDLQQKQL